jgi:hypothetical protein
MISLLSTLHKQLIACLAREHMDFVASGAHLGDWIIDKRTGA